MPKYEFKCACTIKHAIVRVWTVWVYQFVVYEKKNSVKGLLKKLCKIIGRDIR